MSRAALFLLAAGAGCLPQPAPGTSEDALLDDSFPERLNPRYHCGNTWYVASDDEQTLRMQASFDVPFGEEPAVQLSGPLGEGFAMLEVFVGECLWTPGCTDDPDGISCKQEIAHRYRAVGGELTLERLEDRVSGEVTGLRLEGTDGEPAVEIEELALEEAPQGTL